MRQERLTDAELLLLGLVAEMPRHGYELERVIALRGMREWTKIGFSSIYFVLGKLQKAGLVVAKKPDGARAKKIFSVTMAGQKALVAQSLEALSARRPTYPGVLLGMAHWPVLERSAALEALKARGRKITLELERLGKVQDQQQPLPDFVEALFDYSLSQLRAEAEWIDRTLKNMKSKPDLQGEKTMEKIDIKKKLKVLYHPTHKEFSVVEVPDMLFAMIDGEGAPEGENFAQAVQWLYASIYPIKFMAKKKMGKDFVMAPLEGLWWADDMDDFIEGNRGKWKWRLMIVLPDWTSGEMFEEGVAKAEKKLGSRPQGLRMERFKEGLSVQIMHRGPFSDEAPVIARLHDEFLPANGFVENGYHHEIYLNDARRTAPEKLKTVLRQPVKSLS